MAYSGDTRPNPAFRDLGKLGGRGPDLLIHEATMEHFMMNDAVIKKHSTFTEAIEEGKKVEAKFTMLTHFSQRYSKMPSLDEINGQNNVGISFDNMVVSPKTMRFIPSIYPALKRFLWDYQEELNDKAEQYKAKHQEKDKLASHLKLEHFPTPLEEKQEIIDKLKRRHVEKTHFYSKIKKQKTLLREQDERTLATQRSKLEDKL